MKCISLWEPWATLMAIDAKRIETRSWATPYRGLLAIHAAKHWNGKLAEICCDEPFKSTLCKVKPIVGGCPDFKYALKNHILSFGCIVATVDLVDCVRVTPTNRPDGNERLFGGYELGRYMWITRNVRRLAIPVPFTGAQGFFEVPDELLNVNTAIKANS